VSRTRSKSNQWCHLGFLCEEPCFASFPTGPWAGHVFFTRSSMITNRFDVLDKLHFHSLLVGCFESSTQFPHNLNFSEDRSVSFSAVLGWTTSSVACWIRFQCVPSGFSRALAFLSRFTSHHSFMLPSLFHLLYFECDFLCVCFHCF
jgi:hypothetical protein